MCGIVGYVGKQKAAPLIIEGLKRLEYRGYDSAGVAIMQGGRFEVAKKVGRVANLEKEAAQHRLTGTYGMGHTRWATHGGVTDANAHPHVSSDGAIALIHNGVIENYAKIKKFLLTKGYVFISETDTEVLCNLIAYHYAKEPAATNGESRFVDSVRKTLHHTEGTYQGAASQRAAGGLSPVGARMAVLAAPSLATVPAQKVADAFSQAIREMAPRDAYLFLDPASFSFMRTHGASRDNVVDAVERIRKNLR